MEERSSGVIRFLAWFLVVAGLTGAVFSTYLSIALDAPNLLLFGLFSLFSAAYGTFYMWRDQTSPAEVEEPARVAA